ncbi:hypothetical protein B566_EDAN008440, partial [Ephemera danica]
MLHANNIIYNKLNLLTNALEKLTNIVLGPQNNLSEQQNETFGIRPEQQQRMGEREQSASTNQEWFTTNRKGRKIPVQHQEHYALPLQNKFEVLTIPNDNNNKTSTDSKYFSDCYNINFVDDNVINAPLEYSIAHCVSRDLHCGAGIAKELKIMFGGIDILKSQNREVGQVAALPVEPERFILCMVTKEVYYGKPKLSDVERCLWALKFFCHEYGVRKLAIPLIACGLDKQPWPVVQKIIEKIFGHSIIDVKIFTAKERHSVWPSIDESTAIARQHMPREKRESRKRKKHRKNHKPPPSSPSSPSPTKSAPLTPTSPDVTMSTPATPELQWQSLLLSTPQHEETLQSCVSSDTPAGVVTAEVHHHSTPMVETITPDVPSPHSAPQPLSMPGQVGPDDSTCTEKEMVETLRVQAVDVGGAPATTGDTPRCSPALAASHEVESPHHGVSPTFQPS